MFIGEVIAEMCGWLLEVFCHGVSISSHWRLWVALGIGIAGGIAAVSILGGVLGVLACLISGGAGLFFGLVWEERGYL